MFHIFFVTAVCMTKFCPLSVLSCFVKNGSKSTFVFFYLTTTEKLFTLPSNWSTFLPMMMLHCEKSSFWRSCFLMAQNHDLLHVLWWWVDLFGPPSEFEFASVRLSVRALIKDLRNGASDYSDFWQKLYIYKLKKVVFLFKKKLTLQIKRD